MKDNNTFALKMNKGGELLLENSDDAVKAKYKPDSLLLCAPVSYLLMLFCVVIDIAFFRSLFVRISYDSPIMIWGGRRTGLCSRCCGRLCRHSGKKDQTGTQPR